MQQISPRALKVRLDNGAPTLLLDVREDYEIQLSRIPGALHTPIRNVVSLALDELSDYRSTFLVVYCKNGQRGAAVFGLLKQMGFLEVYNLRGGLEAWRTEVDPDMVIA
jgi:rhodanese-related sulfurtransferase